MQKDVCLGKTSDVLKRKPCPTWQVASNAWYIYRIGLCGNQKHEYQKIACLMRVGLRKCVSVYFPWGDASVILSGDLG